MSPTYNFGQRADSAYASADNDMKNKTFSLLFGSVIFIDSNNSGVNCLNKTLQFFIK